jgi:hypothetical protein
MLQTVVRANPVPASAPLPEDLVDSRPPLAVLIEQRPDGVADEPVRPFERPGRLRWRPVIVVAAALLMVLLVGIPLLFLGGGEDETPVATTVPVTTVTAAPTTGPPATDAPTTTAGQTTTAGPTTTTIPPLPSALEISWQQVSSPSLEGGWIAAVTEGGPGLVAVGGTRGPDPALSPSLWAIYGAGVWVSEDGIEWERIDDQSFQGLDSGSTRANAYMTDVAVGPTGRIVAVGEADERATVWWSDDGEVWTRVRHDDGVFGAEASVARHVLAAPFGFVAIGEVGDDPLERQVVSWLSTDGGTWTQTGVLGGPDVFAEDYLGFAGPRLDAVIWNDVVIVVGSGDLGRTGTWRPAIWTTSDGTQWEMVPDDGGGTIEVDPEDAGATMVSVTATADGLIALGWSGPEVGYAGRQRPVTWTSSDARTWVLAQSVVYAEDPQAGMAVIAESSGHLVFAVSDGDAGMVFGSADAGDTWHPIGELDGGIGAELAAVDADQIYWTINDLVPVGDSMVAVGRTGVWSRADDLGGRCSWDESVSCRTDAAFWIGNWTEE